MIIKIVVGLIAGITTSMGLGGSAILLIYLAAIGDQSGVQTTNLIFFIPIAIFSTIMHAKKNLIEKSPVLSFIYFGIIGTIFGIILTKLIPTKQITKLFASFLFFIGLKELLQKNDVDK